ncbi:RNA-binding cell elongation regulator Jag/EloR [Oscillospiraceae bacterium LTW-04]|nr:RNA-binding cell elongation regulator Jag/EloR [Oscillospiraceae bacterium MB24-C1]
MIKEIIATGRTVDAAIDAGCEQLGLGRDEIDFEIIDMPHKGFLGFSQTPAKVRVFKEEPDVETPEIVLETPNLDGKIEVAQQYVLDIVKAMGLDQITVTTSQEENNVTLKINGDVSGVAIGRRGETLDAIQYLTGLAANRVEGDYLRVVIDSGNYRERRRNTLEQLAKKLAAAVIKTGRNTTLEPMNPYERRIIHATISEIEGVTSSSIGEEPNRCVIISSTNPRPQQQSGDRYENRSRGKSNRGSHTGGASDGRRDGSFRGNRGGNRDNRDGNRSRGPRREKPAPYKESSKREVAPAEAANKPLYGKIDL